MAQLQTPGNICTFEGCTCRTWQVHVHKFILHLCLYAVATGSTSGSNDLVKPQKKSSAARRSECKAQDAGGDAEKSIRRPRTPDEKNVRRRDDAHELEGRKSRGYGAATTHRRCAIARRRRLGGATQGDTAAKLCSTWRHTTKVRSRAQTMHAPSG